MKPLPTSPTVVLVHGAWADGSSWHKVITALHGSGTPVTAAPIPLTSLLDDVAAVDRAVDRVGGPVILVGHAYAGAFAQHASAEEQAVLAAVQRPISAACIQQPVPTPRWKTLPSWYLLAGQDRMINPKTQEFMAERMGAQIRSHQADHAPLVTQPDTVTDLITEAYTDVLG
jgi:pimeloyl-ACP methyl ester carboxylesterase